MKTMHWILGAAAAGLLVCAAGSFGAAPAAPAGPAENSQSTVGGTGPLKNELDNKVREAVKKGLSKLADMQGTDGGFNGGPYGAGGENVAIAALAGLAFLADGNMPGQGPYAKNVEKALDLILKSCQESGLISTAGYGSPMYGHGFASLFLAEIYGESPRQDVKEKLQNAIRLLVLTQNKEGGWR